MPKPPKRWELKDRKVRRTIRRLAGEPAKVSATKRTLHDMTAMRINKAGVCQAICDCIDDGETVMETITTDIPEHSGEPAWEFQPTIDGRDMFIKVTICDRDTDHELLLLISAHEQQGGRRQ
ncbi:MAG TPA: hypothetical protein VJ787_09525 [Thermoleophilia bacterium]|nr:hypothetical protein [Thermoleophilia bacterium]